MFRSKVERARLWAKEQRMREDGVDIPSCDLTEENLPSDAELRAEGQKLEFEKGDMKAMIIAGFMTIFPACVVVLLVFALLIFLFAGLF
ncbi:MAG: hypothetical protein E7459_01385 [Ruminococcaceae bacterium]|nr:hypothetical protein [Oscillospiraceae bacterium]